MSTVIAYSEVPLFGVLRNRLPQMLGVQNEMLQCDQSIDWFTQRELSLHR